MKRAIATLTLVAAVATVSIEAWGPQGHRLVAVVATNHLTAAARKNVEWLLNGASLADVAVWADAYLEGNSQTALWHYVNIPLQAASYDRDRDCPRQPGVQANSRNDRWRDCVVDRISYNEGRVGDSSLDRADRAIALKFLVHLIGDLHQPFHALGVERGGNGIPIVLFGSSNCAYPDGTPHACNLHAVWDTALIARRKLTDQQYVADLTRQIQLRGWSGRAGGTAAGWAMESHAFAAAALLPARGAVNDSYYRAQIVVIDERLALGGLRLAAVLNRALTK